MDNLSSTIEFLEDRITYCENINRYISKEKSLGTIVNVEGSLDLKLVDWKEGLSYANKLATKDLIGKERFDYVSFIKFVVYQDVIKMKSQGTKELEKLKAKEDKSDADEKAIDEITIKLQMYIKSITEIENLTK
jgi:hypothetical protein